jgi:hypothetical protein
MCTQISFTVANFHASFARKLMHYDVVYENLDEIG